MSYLSKEDYDRQTKAAAKKMERNSLIETLTPEQHKALRELCRARHFIHSNMKSIFNDESSEAETFLNYFVEGGTSNVLDNLTAAGLPKLDLSVDIIMDMPTLSTYNEIDDMTLEDALDLHFELLERINTEIENYLGAIDEEHGTKYKPTGALRARGL